MGGLIRNSVPAIPDWKQGLVQRRKGQVRHFKHADRHVGQQMADRGMRILVILRVMFGARMVMLVIRMSLADRRVRQLVVARNQPQAERRRKEEASMTSNTKRRKNNWVRRNIGAGL